MEEGESDSNDTDSTVLLDDYEQYPDKIAAKRRKLAEKYHTEASENAAPDHSKDYFNPLLRQKNRIVDQWVMHKYFSSMRQSEKAKDVYMSEDLKIKRELLKQETESTDDIVDQDSKAHNESGSNELDGVIVIDDSDDDSVVGTKDSNDPNSQTSSDVLSQKYVDAIANISRSYPKPCTINARRATTNQDSRPRLTVLKPATINSRRATIHIETDINNLETGQTRVDETNNAINKGNIVIIDSQSNDAPELNIPQVDEKTNATNDDNIVIINSQSNDAPELNIPQVYEKINATNDDNTVIINSRSNDAQELDVLQVDETTIATNEDNIIIINSQSNDAQELNVPQVDETSIATNEDNIGINSQYNDAQELNVPQVEVTSNATNEYNILTINRKCNDDVSSKHTNTSECNESSKIDTITDTLAVDKANLKGISNPEHILPHNEGNNENDLNQRNRHKHKSKRNRKDKKKFINASENSSAIATSTESLHEHISKSHSIYSELTEKIVNVYVDVNKISRKRLLDDITPESNTKRIRNNIDQSNDAENMKNTETNYSTNCAVISENKNVPAESHGQAIDERNRNENETNNQSVMNSNDAVDNNEVFNEEIERVIKFQVGFCTLLKGHLEDECKNKNRDSEKVKAYLKSVESLTNEIENLKALAYDGRVKADIRFACPICTRVSTYSTNLLYSNDGNQNNVEKTTDERCKLCPKMSISYNSNLNKFLRNCKSHNEVACDDANNIENTPDKDSRKFSKESHVTFGCVPEMNTCHNNSSVLGDLTASEGIEQSKQINKIQSNNNLSYENDSAIVEINTSVDIINTEVDNAKENHVLNKSIDVLNAADHTLNKYATSTGGNLYENYGSDTFDKFPENKNNKVVNGTSEIAEIKGTVTSVRSVLSVQRKPCEVSLPNIDSATINNDKVDNIEEIPDNLNNRTTQILLNGKSNTFESTTNVNTNTTDVTTDELPSVLQNISTESERNHSNRPENIVTDDDKVNRLVSCEKVRQINKRKINDRELKMVFKRIKTAENAINTESSLQKEQHQDKCSQAASDENENAKKSNTCAKQKTFSKHTIAHKYKKVTNELGDNNATDIRSFTKNITNKATTNALIKKRNEHSNEREIDSASNETTPSHTEKQNITDVRNKTSENTETVGDKEKSQTANSEIRTFDTRPNNAKEVNNQRNSINGHEQKVPDNHGSNDANYDTDKDQNISVADKLGEAHTTNKANVRRITEKDESLSKAQDEHLVPREENEKNDSSEVSDVSENGKQDASDNSSRRSDETSEEGVVETDAADTGDEDSEDSAEASGTSDNESNNTMRKALDETFEKIKNNLNKVLPPVAYSIHKPHKYLKNEVSNRKDLANKISNQEKVNIKSQVQYMCNICTCIFTYGGSFLRHMMKHKLDLTKISKHCVIRKCSFCHVILREEAVNSHVRTFHPKEYLKVEDYNSEKKPKVLDQHENGTFNYDSKKESIKRNGKWKYFCTLCRIIINSEYWARKHRNDKHPNMKNIKLYDKVSVDEIGSGGDTGDEDNLNDPRNDTDDFGRDSDCDTNETCSKESGSEYRTDEESDKNQDTSNHDDEDSNCGDNCDEENDHNSGDNTDEECDTSSVQPSANNERDHENNDEANQSNGEASSDEGETNRDDDKEPRNDKNATHLEISKAKYFFKCPKCEVTLNSDYAVRKHRKEKHPDLKKKKFIVKVFISENTKPCIDENDKHQRRVLSETEQTKIDEDGSSSDKNHTDATKSNSACDANEVDNVVEESDENSRHVLSEKQRPMKEKDGSDKNHTDESNRDSECDGNVVNREERSDIEEENSDIEQEGSDNDDTSDNENSRRVLSEKQRPTEEKDGIDKDHTDESNSDSECDDNEVNRQERSDSEEENSDIEQQGSDSDDTSDEEKDEQNRTNTNNCDDSDKTDKVHREHHKTVSKNLHSDNSNNLKLKEKLIIRYKCTECDVTLDSRYAVRKHRKDEHSNVKHHKWLARKVWIVTKDLQDKPQINSEEQQGTSDNDMRAEGNSIQRSNNKNINSDNKNDLNRNTSDDTAEQCNGIHKINDPSVNDQIEDMSKNGRVTEDNTEDAATETRSDYEKLLKDQSHSNKNIDKSVDRDIHTIDSIENKKHQNGQVAYKCAICNEYFQSVHFMRIHREKAHPLMSNVKLFEKVITNCPTEEISTKNIERRVEEASKVQNEVEKVTNASDDKINKIYSCKDIRKNVNAYGNIKNDENVQRSVDSGKEQTSTRWHQNNSNKISSDKSTFKKPSWNSGNKSQKNKKSNKLNQKLEENNSEVRKPIYFNCYDCAINFDVNKHYGHTCTIIKEKYVLHNCFACGVNFMNVMEHLCSGNHKTWIDNIEISNIVTIKDAYVFSCLECKYSTDVYDDFLRHCQNHYIEVVDTVKYCGTCQLSFAEHRYETHHNLHAKFEVICLSYTSLFSNWDAILHDIPKDVTMELKTKSMYTTHSIRMAIAEDGPTEYSVYQCDQCKSCVPQLEIEKHCVSKCSDINYVCSVCDRAFISYEMRVNHEVLHRNGAKIFRVIEFNRKEDRKNNLKLIQSRKLQKKDIKTKTPTAELFKCECDLWYVTIGKFQKHIFECNLTCNNGILCPKCHVTRIFLADELDKHLQLHHAEVAFEYVINEINIRRSLEPNEVKCETDIGHEEPTSTELDDAEVKLKREISKQEDDTIVISDDED